jgi:hypothetical protein
MRDGEDTRWSDISSIHARLHAGRLATTLIDQPNPADGEQ